MGFNGNRCKFYNSGEEASKDKILYKNKPGEWLQDA